MTNDIEKQIEKEAKRRIYEYLKGTKFATDDAWTEAYNEIAETWLQRLIDFANFVKLAALSQSRWVSVEERLPEDGKKVLIWGPGYMKGCGFGVYYHKDGDWLGRDNFNLNAETQEYSTRGMNVTHWQPLPQPPTKGSEG